MPSFRFDDPKATAQLTMRHTMCACTGLPRQDAEFLFEFAKTTPQMRFDELAKMKPTTGFGETFQYSNPLVAAGGYVAAKTAYPKLDWTSAYTRVMRTRVFDPIGMKHTTFDTKRATRGKHALPHGLNFETGYQRLPLSIEDAVISVAPAGGAWSTVGDLARAMLVELNAGRSPSGKQLFSEKSLLARHQSGVKISDKMSYGLALTQSTRYGIEAVGHNGNTLGFTCEWTFYPKEGFGLVVLANAQGANSFSGAIRRRLLELLYDGKPEAEENLAHRMKRLKKTIARELAKVKNDPAWLAPLVGRWNNEALGRLVIRQKGDHLSLDAGEWVADAGQKQGKDGVSTLMVLTAPLPGLEFLPKDGKLLLRHGQHEYAFEKKE
jgi:CubicO group peptidase (beta-lactamase class C family)